MLDSTTHSSTPSSLVAQELVPRKSPRLLVPPHGSGGGGSDVNSSTNPPQEHEEEDCMLPKMRNKWMYRKLEAFSISPNLSPRSGEDVFAGRKSRVFSEALEVGE